MNGSKRNTELRPQPPHCPAAWRRRALGRPSYTGRDGHDLSGYGGKSCWRFPLKAYDGILWGMEEENGRLFAGWDGL